MYHGPLHQRHFAFNPIGMMVCAAQVWPGSKCMLAQQQHQMVYLTAATLTLGTQVLIPRQPHASRVRLNIDDIEQNAVLLQGAGRAEPRDACPHDEDVSNRMAYIIFLHCSGRQISHSCVAR